MTLNEWDQNLEKSLALSWFMEFLHPVGLLCPHCAKRGFESKTYALNGPKCRRDLRKCKNCRQQSTLLSGTIFTGSHLSLLVMAHCVFLLRYKALHPYQVADIAGVTYVTAFRLRQKLRGVLNHPHYFRSNLHQPASKRRGRPKQLLRKKVSSLDCNRWQEKVASDYPPPDVILMRKEDDDFRMRRCSIEKWNDFQSRKNSAFYNELYAKTHAR